MSIFYPEYAILAVFIVITACRILRAEPDGDAKKKRQMLARNASTPGADQKSAKRKEKKFPS